MSALQMNIVMAQKLKVSDPDNIWKYNNNDTVHNKAII